ncbi:tRNA (N6-threonylcarbamoyladenosine(37)-N6)-methyltransferase TrmO [[Eubacterium] cellulosolvens]
MEEIKYKPIGVIHTPFKDPEDVPIQPLGGEGVKGTIELETEYISCLKDLDGFSHIFLIYHFHLAKGYKHHVKPFMDEKLHGVFATRAPRRPNPIGLSVVRLIKIERGKLYIKDLDIVDGTPILDIKPYVPQVDTREAASIGWLEKKIHKFPEIRADNRFK